jgi:hypothetical protein
MANGAYDVAHAPNQTAEPRFPDMSFAEILSVAFRGRYIDDIDHPVLKQLRGED